MRQEIGLDPDGAPAVRAFRDDDGNLVFRYLTVRAGGMAVWLPVSDEVMRSTPGGPLDVSELEPQLRDASKALAKSVTAGATERAGKYEELAEQHEALGTELERALDRIRELELARHGELAAHAPGPDAPPTRRQQRPKAA